MAVHPDLIRHVEASFLPSLPEPHREAARLIYAQIRRLEALRQSTEKWLAADPAAKAECDKELAETAVEIREAYKIIVQLASPGSTPTS